MSEQHVPAAVVGRAARARAEEIDQKLLLAFYPVFSSVRPEAAELRIRLEPRQQIVRHCGNRVVTTKTLVEGLLLVGHRLSPQIPECLWGMHHNKRRGEI